MQDGPKTKTKTLNVALEKFSQPYSLDLDKPFNQINKKSTTSTHVQLKTPKIPPFPIKATLSRHVKQVAALHIMYILPFMGLAAVCVHNS